MANFYDKPFKDYDELIKIMESRNIIISDISFAKECLSDISYYALVNGYKDLFPCNEDKFISPIQFEELYALYLIDTNINNILFKNIINIEKSLKSKISYIISKQYGVYTDIDDITNNNEKDYLCRLNYKGSNHRNNTLVSIKNEISKKKKEPDVSHYLNNHNHLPCWILINNIPFGLTIQLYKIMKSSEKSYISNALVHSSISTEDKKRLLDPALQILREYRNKIAHGKKIFVNSISNKMPKRLVIQISNNQIKAEDYVDGIGKNDVVAVILIILSLTRSLSRELFITELSNSLAASKDVVFSGRTLFNLLNLPPDFLERLDKMK